jgi:ABC-2 type transport system ATP-binding protein
MIDVTRAEVSIDGVGLLAPTSMSVGRGEMVALRGPNGAGKTTALRLIMGSRCRVGRRVPAITASVRRSPA